MSEPLVPDAGTDGQPAEHLEDRGPADRGTESTFAGAPFVMGIVGDSGSGMETVAGAVRSLLGPDRVADVWADDYRRYTRGERIERGLTALDPDVHDLKLLEEHLGLLRRGLSIRIRRYDHKDGSFGPARTIDPRPIVLVRGPFSFATEGLRGLYDLSIFLKPEPDLLFRWKLRRDILFRGYTEAQVLKHIASHLLDAKEYVLPQAETADLLVCYDLPDWEAPDSEVLTSLRLRNRAADVASSCLFDELPVTTSGEDGEVVVTIPPDVTEETVATWAERCLPGTLDRSLVGTYADETGKVLRRPSLAVVEVLIAEVAARMEKHPVG